MVINHSDQIQYEPCLEVFFQKGQFFLRKAMLPEILAILQGLLLHHAAILDTSSGPSRGGF